jgi:hypothetical protein
MVTGQAKVRGRGEQHARSVHFNQGAAGLFDTCSCAHPKWVAGTHRYLSGALYTAAKTIVFIFANTSSRHPHDCESGPARQVEDQQEGCGWSASAENRLCPVTVSYDTSHWLDATPRTMRHVLWTRIIPSHVVVHVVVRGESETHVANVILLVRALAYPLSPSTAATWVPAKDSISRSRMFAARPSSGTCQTHNSWSLSLHHRRPVE